MDSSNSGSGINGTHLPQQYHGNPSFSNFINDMEAYAGEDNANDEFSNFAWDPALFAGGDVGSGFQPHQQQQQPIQANLNQTLTRQSNSPALQPHHPAHSQYQQSSYPHPLYDHRNVAQPTFDERFMRPSASPTSFDHHQAYQPMSYSNYGYQQQYARQSSPQNPFYAQRSLQPQQAQQPGQPPTQQSAQQQQQSQQAQMMSLNSRQPSQLSQNSQMENMQMHQFPGNQRVTHTFVNPSMVNSSHMVAMNGSQQGSNAAQPRQQYQSVPYYQKAGSAVDPQLMHPLQMQHYPSLSAVPPQQMQQPSTQQPQHQLQPQIYQQVLNAAQPIQQTATAKPMSQTKTVKDSTTPQKPKAKSNKVKKDGSADSDSSDELEIEEEPPEVKPALLVVSAPTDERGKALYNAVEAVWYPRNKSPPAEAIRKGLAAFGETVRALRDGWKLKNDSLKKAELPNSDTAKDIPRLKEGVASYRQTMESVMNRSLQYGHDAIVKRLGENQFTLSALYSFLLDRTNDMDYDSTLVNNIFKFAVKFETLDEEMLEQVKWSKVLQRWSKKATNDSKEFAQKILANAKAQSARKRAAKSEGAPGSPSSVNSLKKDSIAGVKRPRDGDSGNVPAPKKVVKPSSKPLALQSAERRKAMEREGLAKAAASKGDKDDKSVTSSTSTVASRPKVAMTAPPKANAFAGLLSASKKPGTSNAEKAAAAAAAVKEKAPVSSSVLSTNGPLAAAATKKEDSNKESPPRTLGPVPGKSASSSLLGFLADMDKPKETEVKKIEMDPNETEEQRRNRLRKEARRKLRVSWKPDTELVQVKMFTHDPDEETGQTDSMMRDAGDTMKEGEMLKRHIGMEDVEDDEDDEAALDDFGEYTSPSEVDFSIIDADRAANFVKFGGPNEPESPASDAQAKYEEETLMTTYTFKSDRPDTPKELPSINDDDDFQPVVDFGEPGEKVRAKERARLMRQQPRVPTQFSQPPNNDMAAQLRTLGMPQPQASQQQQPQNTAAFNPYNPQPLVQPAAPQLAAGVDLSKLLAVMHQAQQMQQVQPQQPTYQPPHSNITPNIAALLAQVMPQQNQGLPLGHAGNPNPFPGNDDYNRKHGRNEDGSGEQSNRKKKKGGDNKPYNYKTVVCSFWQEGKCTKGESCTYKHEL